MTIRSFLPTEYFPTSPRAGNDGSKVFRMQNMWLRGTAQEPYAEVYGGSLDLAEDIPTANLTGTVACTINNKVIVGTGTLFTTELHLGQRVEVFGGSGAITILLVVDTITDDTHFTACRAPYATTTGASVVQLPRLFEMSKYRGTLLTGNAVETDLGTILAVGQGTLRRNGAVLPGTSLVATRAPKIAIFNPTTGNYSVAPLGMATPASLTAAAIAGTGKNMQAGVYSGRIVPARIGTLGYNNPSVKAEVTLTAGQAIRFTVPAADTTNLQDAWMFFLTLFTQQGGINGPWYRYELPTAILVRVGAGAGEIPAAGGTYDVEYNDAEISGNNLLSFDNLPPPNAEYIAWLDGIPIWASVQGPGATSPGPLVASAKANNIEAAPPRHYVATSPPDTIIGHYTVSGRLYLLCRSSLQIGVATQTQDPRIPSIVVRPYWKSGFANPDTLIFVDGMLVGMTHHGLARSIAEGDQGVEEFGFATALEEFLRVLSPGHCLLALDPVNNAVCLFESGHSRNASGFWTTRVWAYGLRENKWIGDFLLTSTTTDMIVSGVATVNGRLEFLAGGRTAAATTVVKTYRWDEPLADASVPYYLAWQFGDWGDEIHPKHVGPYFAVNAKQGSGGTAGVYGAEPGDSVPVTALEAGVHATSKSGTITLPTTSTVSLSDVIELNIDNLKQFTVRVDGTWSGGIRDRIDEVVIEAESLGGIR